MVRLIDLPLVVIFWSSSECEHCQATYPVWKPIAESYSSCLPSARLDVADYEEAANAYRIKMLPTIMILRYGRASYKKIQGEATSEQIAELYAHAAIGLDCALDQGGGEESDDDTESARPG
jgi:thioredoxin-like negative regulator of GroEL